MEENKPLDDLAHIKNIMLRSSRSVSLTGMSPIAAGIVGLLGSYLAYRHFFGLNRLSMDRIILSESEFKILGTIGFLTAIIGLGLGLTFAIYEIRKRRNNISSQHVREMFTNLGISLLTGGIIILTLYLNGFVGLALSLSLVFYGLALIHADKYTLTDIKTLGLIQVALGLSSLYLFDFILIIWGAGFGLLHIIYGIVMQLKRVS